MVSSPTKRCARAMSTLFGSYTIVTFLRKIRSNEMKNREEMVRSASQLCFALTWSDYIPRKRKNILNENLKQIERVVSVSDTVPAIRYSTVEVELQRNPIFQF